MNSCAAPEVLSQLLSGTLTEEQTIGVRAHLTGCPQCQAVLDQLTEKPALRNWAASCRPQPQPAPDEPELARLLEKLGAATPTEPYLLSTTFEPADGPLSFLTPPEQEGDLGKLGPYRVLAELGRGGMGIVLLAYDQELQRTVALKVLPPDRADERARARFVREARAAAGIVHDNVVPVYAVASGPDGSPYLVMQYVEGPTLRQRIKAEGRLDPYEAARVCAQAAEGLAAAHRAGLVHRDIKPANIILDRAQGRAKIMDFGLARATSLPAGLTQAGTVLGTPEYMSPEQVQEPERVDGRTDVYSLGVTLYEALTGEVPFRGVTHMVFQQIVSDDPRPPQHVNDKVPRDLETICLKCLHKEPGWRYADAAALAEDLKRFLAGRPIQARPVGKSERLWRWCRRNPLVASLLVTLFVVLAAGLAGATSQWLRAEAKAKELEINLYYHRIALADREALANNWGRVEELLDECPPLLRGWEWHYLKRRRHADPLTPLPLGERIIMGEGFDLAFSPDSRLLAVPSGVNTIKVWDASSGREEWTLRGHTARVLCVAFNPDGRHLASTSEDGTVMVWDLTTGPDRDEGRPPLCTLRGHQDRVIGVAFSPDQGRLLASAGNDGTVKLWDAITGKLLHNLPGQSLANSYTNLAFSPDGRRLAAGSGENTVKVWDVVTGQELFTLPGHTQPVFHVAFSADGRRLVSAGREGAVKVWDLTTGQEAFTFRLHSMGVWCVAFSPDGRHLAVGGGMSDAIVRILDAVDGRIVRTCDGHIARVVSVAFSPDGRRLASASLDKNVKLWDATTGHEVLTLGGHTDLVGRVLFSPDGQRLASASADGTVRVWDASPFDENSDRRVLTLRGHAGTVFGVAFSHDGKTVASASADHLIKIWDTTTGKEVRTLRGHTDTVFSVAFSPGGRRLVSGANDHAVRLWDTQTGEEVLVLNEGFAGVVRSVVFSPDGRRIATGSFQTVQVWDAGTGRPVTRPLHSDPEYVGGVAFSPDGKLLAAVGTNRTARVWNAASGEEVSSFQGHLTRVFSVAFHPRGEYLASGDGDFLVRLWNPATGRALDTLAGHADYILGIAFSPDGQYLATASWREVIIWDAQTHAPIRTLRGLAGTIWSLAYSPDGKHLAAGAGHRGKGEITIWDASIWDKAVDSRRTSPCFQSAKASP
jgi:WD40 repeat protein